MSLTVHRLDFYEHSVLKVFESGFAFLRKLFVHCASRLFLATSFNAILFSHIQVIRQFTTPQYHSTALLDVLSLSQTKQVDLHHQSCIYIKPTKTKKHPEYM